MSEKDCQCKKLDLKATVEKLAGAKTDEEAEAIQKEAVELMEGCQCEASKKAKQG